MSIVQAPRNPLPVEIVDPDGEVIQETAANVLESVTRAEVNQQIVTAKRFPRSITKFLDDAVTLATRSKSIAESCYYRKPQGGKHIEGPSVRLAEIIAHTFGNMRVATRITQETHGYVVAQSVAIDLERNNAVQIEVRRRITDKEGRRYNDDMVIQTCTAAISIAHRKAVFRVVPTSLVNEVYRSARAVAAGKAETVEQDRDKWLAWAQKRGIKPDEMFAALGVKGRDDLGLEQFAQMTGFNSALDDGEATIDAIFRPGKLEAPATTKTDALTAELKAKAQGKGKPNQATLLEPAEPGSEG